jgi:hypothetical protein
MDQTLSHKQTFYMASQIFKTGVVTAWAASRMDKYTNTLYHLRQNLPNLSDTVTSDCESKHELHLDLMRLSD